MLLHGEKTMSTDYLIGLKRACMYMTLIQPSSAAAERVFSLLSNSFKQSEERALEDYTSTSVMHHKLIFTDLRKLVWTKPSVKKEN